ncbi:MAG: hypothetical protein ACREPZ_12525 [Rhodanobacteraceae bacterium]
MLRVDWVAHIYCCERAALPNKKGDYMKRLSVFVFAFAGAALLNGCVATSSAMVKTAVTSPQPNPGDALVVFMRPSRYGGGIQASVYDTNRDAGTDFIGIVSAKTKVAYQAKPGHHLFMVVGENADFMNADLDAGKTYYVLVSPRMGFWKARFSLLPIHNRPDAKYSLQSADFKDWQTSTTFVRKLPAADAWYRSHAGDVAAKQTEYMGKWDDAPARQKAELTLDADDGT